MKRSVTFRLRWILWFLLWNFHVGRTGCYNYFHHFVAYKFLRSSLSFNPIFHLKKTCVLLFLRKEGKL